MKPFFLILFLLASFYVKSQSSLNITVLDSITREPLIGATALLLSNGQGSIADLNGNIQLKDIPNGEQTIRISFVGYNALEIKRIFPIKEKSLMLLLSSSTNEIEEITISVTRTNSRLENSSLKVEVLGNDDMNEENTIKPGNVTSLLGDVSGIQLQQSSAVSGNTNVRIQGLEGKYTQILRDGLPLYEGFSGGFGIMQVPPLDLKQIEIIKGSASTLYGGGAISGIINFVSKTPLNEPEGIITLNQSTLTETNINGYYSKKTGKIGTTLFSGVTRQNAVDVNKDGFSDVPELYSMIIHPRMFYYFNENSTLALGLSTIFENRKGGDMEVLKNLSDSMHSYFEENNSKRYTGDFNYNHKTQNKNSLNLKGSVSLFDLISSSNSQWFGAKQINSYGEASYLIPRDKNDFIFGFNYWGDQFIPHKADTLKFSGYTNNCMGSFVQNTFKWNDKWFVDAGLRVDYHNKYGFFVLPRLAGLYKINKSWYSRIGVAMGFKTPEILSSGIREVNPYLILPFSVDIKSESSVGANIELNYTAQIANKITLLVNQAFFYTQIESPIIISSDSTGYFSYSNATKPIITKGSDTYIRASVENWELYLGYTFTQAEQTYNPEQKYITYTPRHRAAATLVYEIENKWRFGFEGSYNGSQYRDDGRKQKIMFFWQL
ncbi:MAG: TonB-dependent receptor [Bacteroidetes bacterium HGW-Bacteroidetes-21]|nr:MAG: TonB-dependent receptor [Bacteroidetes bacterium HGW-Bacteroidetes-21]